MAILNCNVAVGADDYDTDSAVNSTLFVTYSNVTSPAIVKTGVAELDTSVLDPGWTINSASLYVYTSSYTKDKYATYDRTIWIWDNDPTFPAWDLVNGDTTTVIVGWKSYSLSTIQLSYLNKTGKTNFKFTVSDPGSTYYRSWYIGAYEGGNPVYLVVDYTIPSSTQKIGVKRLFITGR